MADSCSTQPGDEGAFVVSVLATDPLLQCRCWWDERRCPNRATQEDGLCDWCGPHEIAVAGGRESHQREARPTACWLVNSGRRTLTVEELTR